MDTSTNWILNLIDRITEPMRSITAATQGTSEAVGDVDERVKLSQKNTKIALDNEKQHRTSLNAKIKEQEKNLKELETQQKKATGKEWQRIEHDIEKATASVRDYREALKLAEKDIKDLSDDLDHFQQKAANWQGVATGVNQLSDIIGNVSSSLDFSEEIMNLQGNIQLMTGASGANLEDLTANVHRLGAVWGESDAEIAQSANAMSKQMGIGFQEALDIINQGLEKGANLNHDFVDQMKEYPAQIQAAGMSASEGVALIAHAAKDGVFSDKAIDSIKEANLSLKEMGQPQIDALKGIGLEVKDLAGKTSLEAAQMISKAMQGATTQARQLALTDIFKGAGEDAGMGFILGLGDYDLNLENMPSVQAAGAGMKAFFADIGSWIAQNAGGAAIYAQGFADVAFQVNNVTGLVNTLRSSQTVMNGVTKAATLAQGALNIVMSMNPIGLVVIAVAALALGIYELIQHFDWASDMADGLGNSWKEWGTVILDFLVMPLKIVWGVLKSIWDLLNGNWSGAFESITAPFKDLIDDTKAASQKYDEGANGVSSPQPYVFGNVGGSPFLPIPIANQSLSVDVGKDKNKNTLDGIVSNKNTSSSKGKGSDGLSISGGGGSKTTTMNLTVHNHFAAMNSKLDVRAAANEIAGILNDRLRDGLISQA